jgi:3D (Asp-Asp-Asp) domain-containing protein
MSAKAFLRGFAVLSLISALIVPLAASHAQTPVLPIDAWAEQAVQGEVPTNYQSAATISSSVVAVKTTPQAPQVIANTAPSSAAANTVVNTVTSNTATSNTVVSKQNTQVPSELPSKQAKQAKQAKNTNIAPSTVVRTVKAPLQRKVYRAGRSYLISSTAYNSLAGQTDSTPFITATGARTRFGVVALSRDMLRSIPYKSRVMIEDLTPGSRYNTMLANTVFVVEDTMNARIRGRVDVWMQSRSQAFAWGHRRVRITIVG